MNINDSVNGPIVFDIDEITEISVEAIGTYSAALGGTRDKWYVPETMQFIKQSAESRGYYGEHLAELGGMKLCKALSIKCIEQYECILLRRDADGTVEYIPGSYSYNERLQHERIASMKNMLEQIGISDKQYSYLDSEDKVKACQKALKGCIDSDTVFSFISDMCFVDYVIGNTDRHIHNFDVLYRKVADKFVYRMMPLYDFGFGFLSNNRHISETTSNEIFDALIVQGVSCIEFNDMWGLFGQSWQKHINTLKTLGITSEYFGPIRIQGKRYFCDRLEDLGIPVAWVEDAPWKV